MADREAKDALFGAFASVAKALGNGRRAEIIDVLAQGERSVEDLAREIGQSVANTSHHLHVLTDVGLLRTRRSGTHVHYRLASERVGELWGALAMSRSSMSRRSRCSPTSTSAPGMMSS